MLIEIDFNIDEGNLYSIAQSDYYGVTTSRYRKGRYTASDRCEYQD